MIKGFKTFVLRGNVVDLAVAVVIGAAFGAVVTAFVADLITPLIAALFGKPDFSQLSFTVNGSTFMYGAFINALLSFLFIALAVYFFVVAPLNAFAARRQKAEVAKRHCPYCISEVAEEATRCPACASELATTASPVGTASRG